MNNHIIKETSDEVVYLRKLLQQYKIDIKNSKITKNADVFNNDKDAKLKSIDNFIRLTQIIYSKINYGKDLMS